jgi:hypothetical protein
MLCLGWARFQRISQGTHLYAGMPSQGPEHILTRVQAYDADP